MDVDEGGNPTRCDQLPNVVESVEDEEFFEFEEVESIMNADEEESVVGGCSHND